MCSACELKATEQWIAEQQHILPDCDWQHITFTMPHVLWPFFNDNCRCSMSCFVVPPKRCSALPEKWALKSEFSVRCTPTVVS
nr:hypothetical protein [Xenorhabdus japonica]